MDRNETESSGRQSKAVDGFDGQAKDFVLDVGVQWQPVERHESHDQRSERSKCF